MNRQILTLGAWALAAGAGLWHYVYRYALPAAPATRATALHSATTVESSDGRLPLFKRGSITFLDFTSADCGCSQFERPHVEHLISKYSDAHVRFFTIVESVELVKSHVPSVADPHGSLARRLGVGATPAAVILDDSGLILYAGAYNQGRFCDAKDTAFAELALAAITNHHTPPIARTPFFGCAVPLN